MSPTTEPVVPAGDLVTQVLRGDVPPPQRLEDLVGAGRALWESDEEFDDFLTGIERRREEGRSATVQG